MTFHEGVCYVCRQVKEVGRVECIEEDVCLECFNEINSNIPIAKQMINDIIKPQIDDAIRISVRHLN